MKMIGKRKKGKEKKRRKDHLLFGLSTMTDD
jgi:hypothetical protein